MPFTRLIYVIESFTHPDDGKLFCEFLGVHTSGHFCIRLRREPFGGSVRYMDVREYGCSGKLQVSEIPLILGLKALFVFARDFPIYSPRR